MESIDSTLPWLSEVESTTLDLEYYGNRSGSKFCAPVVKHLLNDDYELESTAKISLAKIAKYLKPWKRLWATFEVTYDPLENYNLNESVERLLDETESELIDQDKSNSQEGSLTHGLVDSIQGTETKNIENDIYGLNSATGAPSDKSEISGSNSSTSTKSGTDTTSTEGTENTDTYRDKAGAERETFSKQRYGNIGVTTNQAMLEAERKAWVWDYFDQVFRMIDKELTLAYFDPCRV